MRGSVLYFPEASIAYSSAVHPHTPWCCSLESAHMKSTRELFRLLLLLLRCLRPTGRISHPKPLAAQESPSKWLTPPPDPASFSATPCGTRATPGTRQDSSQDTPHHLGHIYLFTFQPPLNLSVCLFVRSRSEPCGTTPIKWAGRTTQPTACT